MQRKKRGFIEKLNQRISYLEKTVYDLKQQNRILLEQVLQKPKIDATTQTDEIYLDLKA